MNSSRHLTYGMLVLVTTVFVAGFSSREFSNPLLAQKVLQTTPGSQLVSWSVNGVSAPTSFVVAPGAQFPVMVTMRNTQTSTWNPGTHFLSAFGAYGWGVGTRSVTAPVPNAASTTFSFIAQAPLNPGTHYFQWSMLVTNGGFFGQPTPSIPIIVTSTPSQSTSSFSVRLNVASPPMRKIVGGAVGEELGRFDFVDESNLQTDTIRINKIIITQQASSTATQSGFFNFSLMKGNTRLVIVPTATSKGNGFFEVEFDTSNGSVILGEGGTETLRVIADAGIGTPGTNVFSIEVNGVRGVLGTAGTPAQRIGSPRVVANAVIVGSTGPTILITSNVGLTPPAGQVVMGSTNNVLAAWTATETSNLEEAKITQMNVYQAISSTTLVKQSFVNVGIYMPGDTVPRAVAATAKTAADGRGYYYTFNFSEPITTPKSGSASFFVKADVAPYNTSGSTDLSHHIFKIATSSDTDNDYVGETVVAFGKTSNATASVLLVSPAGYTQTVQRTRVLPSAQALGASVDRTKTSVDDLANIILTADTAGAATLGRIRLSFSGNAVTANLPTHVTLVDQNGLDIVSSYGAVKSVDVGASCTQGAGCAVRWTFAPGTGPVIDAGSSLIFRVRLNSIMGTAIGAAGQSVALAVTVTDANDISYSTSIPGGGGLPGAILPTTVVPFSIQAVSYAHGT